MHWDAIQFVATIQRYLPEYFKNTKVLEIGSYIVNETIRPFFLEAEYIGIDLCEGPGVDVVSSGHEVTFSENFDVTISCECFEHNRYYKETFANMVLHTKPGGLCVFTCATTGRAEHGTIYSHQDQSPGTQSVGDNYYRNVYEDDFDVEYLTQEFSDYKFFENPFSYDLYFIGIKKQETSNEEKNERLLPKALVSAVEQFIKASEYKNVLMSGQSDKLDEKLLTFLEALERDVHPMILENIIAQINKYPTVLKAYLQAFNNNKTYRQKTAAEVLCQARLLWELNEKEKATRILEENIYLGLGHWQYLTFLAVFLRGLGARKKAIRFIEAACSLENANPWTHQERVQTYASLGIRNKAYISGKKSLFLFPQHSGLLYAAGCAAIHMKDYKFSEACFRKLLQKGNTDKSVLQALLSVYDLQGDKTMKKYVEKEIAAKFT